jgi:hypothetical protein
VERTFDPLPIDDPADRSFAEIVADAGRNEGPEAFRNTLFCRGVLTVRES